MLLDRTASLRERVRRGVWQAFAADHTPHQIAASFAFGVLVTALPTAGMAIPLFVVVAYLIERASKLALVASLVVFNPLVKWGVYAASFWLGTRLLGPVPGVTVSSVSLSAGSDLVLRQLLGNVVLAVALAGAGYLVALAIVRAYRRRGLDAVELASRTPSE